MQRAAVFGLGHFGSSVAMALYDEGVEVLAVDLDRSLVDRIKDEVSIAVAFDATIRQNLDKFNVAGMDCVIVGMGDDFEASAMVTILCREIGVKRIVCKALTLRQKEVLLKIGADEVIMPEEQMGRWLATNLVHSSIVNLVELPQGFSLLRVVAQDAWYGKTLSELELLRKERLNLIQVHRLDAKGRETKYPLPSGDFHILPGDELDIIGSDKRLERFEASEYDRDRKK